MLIFFDFKVKIKLYYIVGKVIMMKDNQKEIFATNLKKLLNERNLAQVDVAKAINVSPQTFNTWVKGIAIPRMGKIQALADYFNILKSDLVDEQANTHTTDYSKYGLISLENRRTKKVPILGDVACGIPIYAEETYDDYIEVDEDIRVDFALRTKGDSMIGDNIVDGDIVLVKKVSMVEPHEIAVVVIDDEATLKRVKYDRENNIVMLIASNHNVAPIIYSGEELERINILGKAVLLQRRL